MIRFEQKGNFSKLDRYFKRINNSINNVDFDVVGFVVKRMAYDIARFIEKNLLGFGGGSITGLGDATNVKTLASANTITGDDLIEAQGMVKDVYQAF